LRHYLEGGAEALVERALRGHFAACRPDWETDAATLLARGRDVTARVKALVRYYRERVSSDHPSTVLEGLLGLYEHEQVHFSKMVARLMPILNWPDSRGLLERLACGLAEQEPAAAALQARVHAIAVAAINAHKAAKKAGVPDRERFAAFFDSLVGAPGAPEHAVLAQALTADQRRILGGRLRAVRPAPVRVESAAGTPDA
jgi:hypothetical protein